MTVVYGLKIVGSGSMEKWGPWHETGSPPGMPWSGGWPHAVHTATSAGIAGGSDRHFAAYRGALHGAELVVRHAAARHVVGVPVVPQQELTDRPPVVIEPRPLRAGAATPGEGVA